MRKIPRIGRGLPIVSKLDKHVVLVPNNYIARLRESPQVFSFRIAQHATGQALYPRFCASLSVLVLIILPQLE